MADQWRWDAMSVAEAGSPARTPFLDQLAGQGCLFTNAYSPSPTCIPARACFATGRSPFRAGRCGYLDHQPWPYQHTWMSRLRDAGYQTIGIGKTHFHPMRARLGFEEQRLYEASQREPGVVSDYHQWLHRVSEGTVQDVALQAFPNSWTPRPWTHRRDWHCTEWMTREAIDRLENRDPTRPFAIYTGYHRPHPPFDPPLDLYERWLQMEDPGPIIGDWCAESPKLTQGATAGKQSRLPALEERQARAAYFAGVSHFDEQIGALHWYLQRNGLLANTWIVVTSDHGEGLGDHYRWHKGTLLRCSAGIPLIIRPPGARQGGTTCRTAVDLSDLGTTLCAWGRTNLPNAGGMDLSSLIAGEEEPERIIHGEHLGPHAEHALRDARWTYLWDSQSGMERLFDRENDPHECYDLARSHPGEVKKWRELMVKTLKERPEGFVQGSELQSGTQARLVAPELREGRDPLQDSEG